MKQERYGLPFLLRELRDQLVDDRDVLVPLLVGHELVVDVDLDDLGLADDDGRRVAGADRPENKRRTSYICKHNFASIKNAPRWASNNDPSSAVSALRAHDVRGTLFGRWGPDCEVTATRDNHRH